MGAVKSSLVLNDGMSTALRRINKAMGLVLDSFNAVQQASGQTFDTANISAARQEIGRANAAIEEMEQNYRDCNDQQDTLNKKMAAGTSAAGGLLDKVKGIAAAYLGMKGIGWVKESLSLFDTQNKAAVQLKTVLGNMGASPGTYEALKNQASALQGKTSYGDEILLGGAAEFATYMSDDKAISKMMETLTNYAAGMSGGGEVGYEEMVNYATGLGKIMTGSYDAMTKKGFEFTDQQKKIIENGTAMEKALVISDVINESWDGLAERMANTPEGKIIQLKNTFGDMREELAARIYPTVMRLFDKITENTGSIKDIILGLASPINFIVEVASIGVDLIIAAFSWMQEAIQPVVTWLADTGQHIKDNWDGIAPVLSAVASALAVLVAVFLVYKLVTAIATAAQWLFNAALWACPITWIIVAIIAVIAAIYLVIAAINKITGSTISATGIIMGALATAGAFIWDLFLGILELILGIINYLVNPILAFVNFFGNVFNDPIGSIIHLFGDLADNVLAVLQKIASALDFVFGSNMAGTIQGWRNSLTSKVDTAAKQYGNGQYEQIMGALDLSVDGLGLSRIEYSDAWAAGYNFGENIENGISNFDVGSLFGTNDYGVTDYVGYGDAISDIADNTGTTASNTGKSSEELSYLRDIAEKEAINRFTTAEIHVDMTGMTNRIDSDMDIDGIISYLTEGVADALTTVGEGVY